MRGGGRGVSFTIPVSGVNGSGLWTTNTEKRNNSICLPPPPPLARNEMVYQCGTGGSARLFTFAGSEINSIERRLNGRRINQRFNPEKRDVWRRGDLCLPARRTYAKISPPCFHIYSCCDPSHLGRCKDSPRALAVNINIRNNVYNQSFAIQSSSWVYVMEFAFRTLIVTKRITDTILDWLT